MARTSSSDTKLDGLLSELSALLKEGCPTPDPALLQPYLRHRNPCVVAQAALCAERHQLVALISELQQAFERWMPGRGLSDKGCIAKKGMVKALDALSLDDSEWFVWASQCVQWEPSIRGQRDAAVEVRSLAVMALTRFPWFQASYPLVTRLGDGEAKVRAAAIQALACFSGSTTELIVLTKLMAGDEHPEIIGECFRALISLGYTDALPLIATYLDHAKEDIRVEALFAIGGSRTDSGFALLKERWDSTFLTTERTLILNAMALLRTLPAKHFLLELVNDRQYGSVVKKALEGL